MVAKFWKSPEILSSFFFQVPEVRLQGCMGSKSPPKNKSILLGTGQCDGCMINDMSPKFIHAFPEIKKTEGVKLSNVSFARSRRAAQNPPLQGLRVASRGIQNAIEQT